LKRLTDILLGLLLLPLATLVCVLAAFVIRIEGPGSPLFLQARVGRDQKPFTLWKMRSMKRDTASVGSHEVSGSKITKVGQSIRRTKIDELPQIVNVLLGQMSFVGPRPCLPSQAELIAEREARGVFTARPGITGPAQVAGIDMSTPRLLAKTDAQYVAERTMLGDLKLILLTGAGGGRGDATRQT
jgi:O-antigen biosynthesis protein WbqP